MAMFTRAATVPRASFFLFGPRGTGKTTWLRHALPAAEWFDLLDTDLVVRLQRDPAFFGRRLAALRGGWVVLDEIQRLPALLNDVQAALTRPGGRLRFALCGSSARKLRRLDANLLAGRALRRDFLPLTGAEMNHAVGTEELLRTGTLPLIRAEPELARERLAAYVSTYLREEVQQEALVRRLDSFVRFLDVAAQVNGQIVNIAGVARDAGVARPTVQGYFQVLADTLLGVWLPAWQRRARVKEVASPKFYFFDSGVVRALRGREREPLDDLERGFLLETLVLHELRAWQGIHDCGGRLAYWRTPAGAEVDFVWTRGAHALGFEVKSATAWRSEHSSVLRGLLSAGILTRAFGVYGGRHELRDGPVTVLPVETFQRRLAEGEIFPG